MIEAEQRSRRTLLRTGVALVVLAASTAAFAADTDISIDNFKFAPTPLTVKPGTIVTWTNRDDIPHSIIIPALGLRSHPIDTNESFSHRFQQTGRFDYMCGLHPFMRGTVVIAG